MEHCNDDDRIVEPDTQWMRKKIELLEFEIKLGKLKLDEQQQYIKSLNNLIQDLLTPLAKLHTLLDHCSDIPEHLGTLVRTSMMNIDGAVQDLLNQHERYFNPHSNELAVPLLLSTTLINIISDKKYQYRNRPIQFAYRFTPDSFYSFIQIQPSAFRCAISNLISNAIAAIENQEGQVCVVLELSGQHAKITVEDNGHGMSEELIHKIKNRLPLPRGKTHGIGLTQIYHTLDSYQGSLEVYSAENVGSKISLAFPLTAAPEWMAKMMVINPDNIIVILDNDQGVHDAWDAYFAQTLLRFHEIKIKHFTLSEDAIAFIQSLSEKERQRILMLTDYDLISHDFDGLTVLDTLQPAKTLLVTSQYPDTTILQGAARRNTKIIPRHLVNQIPIYIQC